MVREGREGGREGREGRREGGRTYRVGSLVVDGGGDNALLDGLGACDGLEGA